MGEIYSPRYTRADSEAVCERGLSTVITLRAGAELPGDSGIWQGGQGR